MDSVYNWEICFILVNLTFYKSYISMELIGYQCVSGDIVDVQNI